MNVARFAARNSRVILLGIVLLSAAGLYAALTLPSNIYPEVEFPRIQMVARAGDLSPGMMQLAVTRPLEEAARTVLGVRRVRSKTIRGRLEISVIFNPDANMPYSLQLMQAKADEVRPELPAGTELVVERMTPSLFPILSINVTGALPAADLRDLAVYQLRPLLSRVPGVANVEVLASEEREISVIVDPDRLNAAKLTLEQVSDALKATNQVVSAGRLPKDYRQYLVLASGELHERRGRAPGRGGVPAGHAALPRRPGRGARGRDRPHHADQRQRTARRAPERGAPDPRQHPRGRRRGVVGAQGVPPLAAAVAEAAGGLRPRRVRAQRRRERARRDPDRRAACRCWCWSPSCATCA